MLVWLNLLPVQWVLFTVKPILILNFNKRINKININKYLDVGKDLLVNGKNIYNEVSTAVRYFPLFIISKKKMYINLIVTIKQNIS